MVSHRLTSNERSQTRVSTCSPTPNESDAEAIKPRDGEQNSEAGATQAPHALASPENPMTKRECTEQAVAKSDLSALSESHVMLYAQALEATKPESSGLSVERVGARVVVAGETLVCYMLCQCAVSVVKLTNHRVLNFILSILLKPKYQAMCAAPELEGLLGTVDEVLTGDDLGTNANALSHL
jgi:hypothetical protein